MMARPTSAAALALALAFGPALAACSPDHRAAPLDAAVSGLKPLHSGRVTLTLTWSAGADATAGFGVEGPFADPSASGRLPVFSLTSHQIGGADRPTTLISDGSSAVAQGSGGVHPLSAQQLNGLRAKQGEDLTGLRSLGVASWATGPETKVIPPGSSEETISSAADPVAALNSIVNLANASGSTAPLQTIPANQAATVRQLLTSSHLDVTVGTADHLLHHLHLSLGFAPSSQSALRSAVGASANVEMRFDVVISQPNQPISVTLPTA